MLRKISGHFSDEDQKGLTDAQEFIFGVMDDFSMEDSHAIKPNEGHRKFREKGNGESRLKVIKDAPPPTPPKRRRPKTAYYRPSMAQSLRRLQR